MRWGSGVRCRGGGGGTNAVCGCGVRCVGEVLDDV